MDSEKKSKEVRVKHEWETREFGCDEWMAFNNMLSYYNENLAGYNNIYAYTQTVEENKFKKHSEQYHNITPDLCCILGKSCEYYILPEFTKQEKIHYHGILAVRDMVKWRKQTHFMLQRFGFMQIRKLHDVSKWIRYCIKDSVDNYNVIFGPLGVSLGKRICASRDKPVKMREIVNKKQQSRIEYTRLCNNCLDKLIEVDNTESDDSES